MRKVTLKTTQSDPQWAEIKSYMLLMFAVAAYFYFKQPGWIKR